MNLLEKVAEKVSQSGPEVANIVIDSLVKVEITKRVELITVCIKKHDELEKQFKKINRPDVINYDAENNEVKYFSANRKKEIDSQSEKLTKFKDLIDSALYKNTEEDYKKLKEMYDKLGANQNSSKSES